jgi:hypothetical protein
MSISTEIAEKVPTHSGGLSKDGRASSVSAIGRRLGPPRSQDLIALGFGLLIGIAVCVPFFRPGTLWLLDWGIGPHFPTVPLGAYGLANGVTTGVPLATVFDLWVHLLGPAGTWLPLLLVFPLASWSVARLVGGTIFRVLPAAAFYSVNPFVFDRIYVGHIALLLGYALLPLATKSALNWFRGGRWWLPAPALWWAVLTAMSPHFCWIYGVVVLVCCISGGGRYLIGAGRLLTCIVVYALSSAYIALPSLAGASSPGPSIADLSIYRTTGDPHLGLFLNVLGLYGFWRLGPGPIQPKAAAAGWVFILFALLVVAIVGAVGKLRGGGAQSEDRISPSVVKALLAIGLLGYLLALGEQGPTGAIFRWAYFHVPFFAIMREPQKWAVLVALTLSVMFGLGAERLVGTTNGYRVAKRANVWFAASLLLPLAYAPTIFDGLAGQIGLSRLPASWATADKQMGTGDGQILFLPWHLYLAFPFTGGRVISNPAPTSFRRTVISGDNVEVTGEQSSSAPRSVYVQQLLAHGNGTFHFGQDIAPLGVQYVVLAKSVDWRNYSWLTRQSDLRMILDSSTLEVWESTAFLSSHERQLRTHIVERSPVAYEIIGRSAGQLNVPVAFQAGWEAGGHLARASRYGTLQISTSALRETLTFRPWAFARAGYLVSSATVVLLGLALASTRRSARRRRHHEV